MRTAWILLFSIGCGVNADVRPTPDVAEHSGSRLRVEWWEALDGSLQLRGIYDTAIDGECTFQLDEGGELACLPVAGGYGDFVHASLELAGYGRVVSRALHADDGLVIPYDLYDTVRGPCVPQLVPGTTEFTCTPAGAVAAPGDPELALVSDSDDGHRLERRYWATAEGLRQHTGTFWDDRLAIDCTIRAPSQSASAYCLPTGAPLGVDAPDYELAFPTVDP